MEKRGENKGGGIGGRDRRQNGAARASAAWIRGGGVASGFGRAVEERYMVEPPDCADAIFSEHLPSLMFPPKYLPPQDSPPNIRQKKSPAQISGRMPSRRKNPRRKFQGLPGLGMEESLLVPLAL